MGLSDTIKDNIMVIVAAAFATGAGIAWGVAEKVRVEPKNDEIARLERTIAALEVRPSQRLHAIEQKSQAVRPPSAENQRQTVAPITPKAEAARAVSVINIEDPKFAGPQRPPLTSPIQVTWVANGRSIDSNLVVQLYRNGRLVIPASDSHEEHSSGVVIPLKVGTYELKLWNPGAERPLRSIWFDIVER
jgi:hypothetical protein